MKKSVVAISDNNAEISAELISILHDAGIAVRRGRLNASARDQKSASNDPASVVAVVYEVPLVFSSESLRQVIQSARCLWPAVPLIACINGAHRRNLLRQIIARADFNAIADSAAQLPALLREVEERCESGDLPQPVKHLPEQTTLALPTSMRKQELRGAFTLVASLHGAMCEDQAASFAVSGLGRLISADRWAVYLARENRADALSLGVVVAREFSRGESLSFDCEWQRELLESVVAVEAVPGTTAEEAVTTMTTVKRS